MSDLSEAQPAAGRQAKPALSEQVEREILQAISRLEYGSVEVVVHDGRVVQIECRERIRVAHAEPDRRDASRRPR